MPDEQEKAEAERIRQEEIKVIIADIKNYFKSKTYLKDKAENEKKKVSYKGHFPDDYFDQELSTFFEDLDYEILKAFEKQSDIKYEGNEELFDYESPNCIIDLSIIDVDEAVANIFKDDDFMDKLMEAYPKEYLNTVRNWMIMNLDDFFLFRYYDLVNKFSSDSIDNIAIGGVKNLLQSQFFIIRDNIGTIETIETWIIYIYQICSWYEIAHPELIYKVIDKLFIYIGDFRVRDYYMKIMFLIEPEKFVQFPFKKGMGKNVFLECIIRDFLDVERSSDVPDDLFSSDIENEVRNNIEKRLMNRIQKENVNLDDKNYPKIYQNLLDLGYQLFFHFAYFGFVNGKIPGIKQGASKIDDLRFEIEETKFYYGIELMEEDYSILMELEKNLGGKVIPVFPFLKKKLTWNSFGFKVWDHHVVELSLYKQGLTTLLDSICQLSSLKKLYLNGNKLLSLPQSMIKLIHLKELDVRDNSIDRRGKSVLKQLEKKGIHIFY